MKNLHNRVKNAEILSLLGAVVAGAGAALFFPEWLDSLKFFMLVGGLLIHAAAMFYRQRLERTSGVWQTRWETLLYWLCWLFIWSLAAYLFFADGGPAA